MVITKFAQDVVTGSSSADVSPLASRRATVITQPASYVLAQTMNPTRERNKNGAATRSPDSCIDVGLTELVGGTGP